LVLDERVAFELVPVVTFVELQKAPRTERVEDVVSLLDDYANGTGVLSRARGGRLP